MNLLLSEMASNEAPAAERKERGAEILDDVLTAVVETAEEAHICWTDSVLPVAEHLIRLVRGRSMMSLAEDSQFTDGFPPVAQAGSPRARTVHTRPRALPMQPMRCCSPTPRASQTFCAAPARTRACRWVARTTSTTTTSLGCTKTRMTILSTSPPPRASVLLSLFGLSLPIPPLFLVAV